MELVIIEHLLDEATKAKVAKAIIDSQDVHEKSWNGRSYTITHMEAAEKALNDSELGIFWIGVIAYLNLEQWNDAQMWAENIINNHNK